MDDRTWNAVFHRAKANPPQATVTNKFFYLYRQQKGFKCNLNSTHIHWSSTNINCVPWLSARMESLCLCLYVETFNICPEWKKGPWELDTNVCGI